MRRPPVLFFAGSYSQASYWAEQLGFGRYEWQYVTPQSIRGHRCPTVYVVGTYWERPDWPEFLDAIAPTGAEPIFAEEMVP